MRNLSIGSTNLWRIPLSKTCALAFDSENGTTYALITKDDVEEDLESFVVRLDSEVCAASVEGQTE